jgi:hypothetical protein
MPVAREKRSEGAAISPHPSGARSASPSWRRSSHTAPPAAARRAATRAPVEAEGTCDEQPAGQGISCVDVVTGVKNRQQQGSGLKQRFRRRGACEVPSMPSTCLGDGELAVCQGRNGAAAALARKGVPCAAGLRGWGREVFEGVGPSHICRRRTRVTAELQEACGHSDNCKLGGLPSTGALVALAPKHRGSQLPMQLQGPCTAGVCVPRRTPSTRAQRARPPGCPKAGSRICSASKGRRPARPARPAARTSPQSPA